jgi:2-oxo-hept-3-ene-1,7-dioate hydratase
MVAQLERFHAALAAGGQRYGWKVAFNDPAAQQRFGLGSPPVGWTDGSRALESGATVALGAGQRVHIEAEVMLHIGRDVAASEPREALRDAIAGISPAIELVDYALPGEDLARIVEYSMFHAGTVVGVRRRGIPADASAALSQVLKNGEQVAGPIGGRVPADLAEIAGLVAAALEAHGERLLAGDRVICGSYIAPFPVGPGDRVVAEYGFGLGTVAVSFTGAD